MQDESSFKSPEPIPQRIARLKSYSVAELKQQWQALYHSDPALRISRELLTRAVTYRIQEQVYGGLKPSTRRLLIRLANDARSGRPLKPEPTSAAPAGTVSRLARRHSRGQGAGSRSAVQTKALKTLRKVGEELNRRSIVSKRWVSKGSIQHGGFSFGRGALYHLLANPIYQGEIRHKSVAYPPG